MQVLAILSLIIATACLADEDRAPSRDEEAAQAYLASPFSEMSRDYFARFHRDPNASRAGDEMVIGPTWRIRLTTDAHPVTELMAENLRDFLNQRMAMRVAVEKLARDALSQSVDEIWLNMRPVFEQDDPVFTAHPEARGAQIYDDAAWYQKAGNYILCTEPPLVQRYISETIRGIFEQLPGLSGIGVIIGGEEFHHCFMRPYGADKGHTNCPRCEALGHHALVANLCNYMAHAAREVNPAAEVFAWPYSAAQVWSIGDPAQLGFIARLQPGVTLFADCAKDDTLVKPGGVSKCLWDYSIDLPGPGQLAQQQLQACHDRGVPIHFKSEPELSFEASKIPGFPCMDRWVQRADALTTSDVDGIHLVRCMGWREIG